MRPLLALILAACILGGVQWFLAAKGQTTVAPPEFVEVDASGEFTLEVVLTFDAGPDPFALDAGNAPSLTVNYRGQSILSKTKPISAGTRLQQPLAGIVEGANELYLTATPQDTDVDAVRAARVRILRDSMTVAEKWLASEPGEPVQGTVTLVVPTATAEAHDHD